MQYIHALQVHAYYLVSKTQKAQDILSVHFLNRQQAKVSLLGVDSLWVECMFIPVYWGS